MLRTLALTWLLAAWLAPAPSWAADARASTPMSAPTSTPASTPASMAASAAATLQPPPEEPPPLGESPVGEQRALDNPYTALLRVVLVLAGVILLAYLVLQKGLGSLTNRMTKGRLLRVVDRIGLEPKKTIYVVEVAGRYYLIGTTDHGVSCLAALGPDGQPSAAPGGDIRSFDEMLRGKTAPVPPAKEEEHE